MEKNLEVALQSLVNKPGVTGCVVSNKQGLCLGCKGTANPNCSGFLTAINEIAKKLHPNESEPIVVLEDNEKQCLIQSNDKIVVSIYKTLSV